MLDRLFAIVQHVHDDRNAWRASAMRFVYRMATGIFFPVIAVWSGLVALDVAAPPSRSIVYVLVIIFLLTFAFSSIALIEAFAAGWVATRPLPTDFESRWRQPMASTDRYASTLGDPQFVAIGGAITVKRHPLLTRDVYENGWHPSQFRIDKTMSLGYELAAELRENPLADPNNNKKYSLIRVQHAFREQSDHLVATVAETDWNTLRTAQRAVEPNEALRHSLISIDPSQARVPNSFCLHALVTFPDHSVLATKRLPDTPFFPNSFAFSFEEQISDHDFRGDPTAVVTNWIRRTICEELFPLTALYEEAPDIAWAQVNDFVGASRIWSIFLEELNGNFSCFAHIPLLVSREKYLEIYGTLVRRGHARDDEGRLYVVAREDLAKLVEQKRTSAHLLVNDASETISSLHPTSLYRVVHYLQALGDIH